MTELAALVVGFFAGIWVCAHGLGLYYGMTDRPAADAPGRCPLCGWNPNKGNDE